MSFFTTAAFSLLPALWPFHPPQSVTRDYTLPIWQISMTKDKFAGQIQCRVYQGSKGAPKVSYSQHSLVFHFQRKLNTLEAVYRLDGGAPKRWQDLYPKVVEEGGTLDGASMTNPTGGVVIVPLTELSGVHTISIRPTPNASPRTFIIDGYSDAIEAARARGCTPETVFVR